MTVRSPSPVRPELVEGLSFSSAASKEEGQPFDKLRANGEISSSGRTERFPQTLLDKAELEFVHAA